MRRALLAAVLATLGTAPAGSENGLNQNAVVYIAVSCEDPHTGAISEPKGTGFIIDESGYIITAFHVISCWDQNSKVTFQRKEIAAHLGSPAEPARPAQIVRSDEQADIALLMLQGAPRQYPALKICSLRNPPAGMPFLAAGFPEGMDYQPVEGMIGNLVAAGGGWSATAPFAPGMSGGPVTYKGSVVGLIKGGVKDVIAVNTIIPLYKARSMIESETGKDLAACGQKDDSVRDGGLITGGIRMTDFTGTWRIRLGDDEGNLVIKQVSEADRHFSGRLELAAGAEYVVDQSKGWWDGSAFAFQAHNNKGVLLDVRGRYCVHRNENGSWIIVNGDMLRKNAGVTETLKFVQDSYEEICPVAGTPVAPRRGSCAFYASAVLEK
jgi:hypothetical protein